jgi:D-alanyl-D-alanine carboxypeptidase/D-alanyl-D-alanine-endopeptidase (penicillin-binding protein 4)
VAGRPEPHRAGDGASPVAGVESAPVSQIVERMLTVSDNEAAEVLAHQVGLATVGEASFAGGTQGIRQALTELGVGLADADTWYDGSGLSRDNVLTPPTLLAVLGLAASADHPELRALLAGLPVAGFSGSLEYRFVDTAPEARGRVRAKTGTLRGTSSLAGIATDLDGTSVAFVLMADRVPLLKTLAARDALDAAAAAIGGCRCSVGSSP